VTTISVVVATLILPFTPLSGLFGFSPLPVWYFLYIGMVITGYIITAEIAKTIFYKRLKF
jgi:Mg2+-importing ATPase